jgi:hypothetical protein
MGQKEYELHLTELILSIHNEVQSAVDYISEVGQKDGTELGRSTAILGVQNLRIKLPFEVTIEQKVSSFPVEIASDRPKSIKTNLRQRKGFTIDIGETNKRALFTKVKVLSLSQPAAAPAADAGAETIQKGLAELEITFSPFKRD